MHAISKTGMKYRHVLDWNTDMVDLNTDTVATYICSHLLILLHHALVLLVHVEDLANTLGGLLSLSRAREGVVVGGDIGHDGTLIWLRGGMYVCLGQQN